MIKIFQDDIPKSISELKQFSFLRNFLNLIALQLK